MVLFSNFTLVANAWTGIYYIYYKYIINLLVHNTMFPSDVPTWSAWSMAMPCIPRIVQEEM